MKNSAGELDVQERILKDWKKPRRILERRLPLQGLLNSRSALKKYKWKM